MGFEGSIVVLSYFFKFNLAFSASFLKVLNFFHRKLISVVCAVVVGGIFCVTQAVAAPQDQKKTPQVFSPFKTLDKLLSGGSVKKPDINKPFIYKKTVVRPTSDQFKKEQTPLLAQLSQAQARENSNGSKRSKRSLYSELVRSRNEQTVTIVSGEVPGSNVRMAADIANVLDDDIGKGDFRVIPIVGRGGVQNVLDVLFLKGVDMAIIQQGQLGYLELQDPEFFKDIRTNIQYVAKLHNTEIHVIAHKRIKSLQDLKGKRVMFGKKLGTSDMVARYIFTKLGIDVIEVNDDMTSGIQQLHNNTVEAAVLMGGAPLPSIANIKHPENYHFLAIEPQTVGIDAYFNLVDEFLPTKLSAADYPNIVRPGEHVSSVSSGVVLVAYNWKPDSKRYKKLANFIERFFSKFRYFREPSRHPKWMEVNMFAKVDGWLQFKPAKDWLEKRRQVIGQEVSAGEMEIAMDTFVRQYSKHGNEEQVSPLQRDDMWSSMNKVFGRWWKSGQ